jgi:hypothetical protein
MRRKTGKRVKKYKLFINLVKLENKFWKNSEQYRTMIYEIHFVLFLIFNEQFLF